VHSPSRHSVRTPQRPMHLTGCGVPRLVAPSALRVHIARMGTSDVDVAEQAQHARHLLRLGATLSGCLKHTLPCPSQSLHSLFTFLPDTPPLPPPTHYQQKGYPRALSLERLAVRVPEIVAAALRGRRPLAAVRSCPAGSARAAAAMAPPPVLDDTSWQPLAVGV